MVPTHNNSASASIPAKKDDGSNHLVECTGPEMDGNGCIIWTNVWVSTLIPKNFARPFLGGFCAVEELQPKTSTVDDRWPIIEADSIEQYGRRENVRIFGVEEDEDVFAKVVSVAEKAGVKIITITATDVSTCHHLPVGGKGPKPLFAKFVRWDTEHQLMKHKRNLKETSICVNDDLMPSRAKLTRDLKSKDDVRGVVTANEKFIVFMQDNQKLVFDNLYKL